MGESSSTERMTTRMTKDFAVFDCDAHVDDPKAIWDEYVAAEDRALVQSVLPHNGAGMPPGRWGASYNPIAIAGPQMNKRIMRKLLTSVPLTPEQQDYVLHKGSFDPHARITEMDLMGIDQVLVIPTLVIASLPLVQDPRAVAAFCEGYHRWVKDWCSAVPDRLFGAGLLAATDPSAAVASAEQIVELGLPVALLRPIEGAGGYPNRIDPEPTGFSLQPQAATSYDRVFRVLEESGVCLGMHTFPGGFGSPGMYAGMAGTNTQTLSFIFEAQTWLGQVLLSGFLDQYPNLKMLIFESNSEWLPFMLDECDRLFDLYANERTVAAKRRPSEAFAEQCMISFESDEDATFHQWEQFEDIGVWASDCYHHDGADSWSAMRHMDAAGVPRDVQAKLLGANARRVYGIEGKMFVHDEPGPIERPAWFPGGPELEEWAELVADPRRHADALRAKGFDQLGFPLGARRDVVATGSYGTSR